jgi:stage V sporulation protein K
VLFIDEAYSLARGGEKDFGKEAIDTLVNTKE